jgi:acyl carrier protein
MNESDLYEILNEIFTDVFDLDELTLSGSTVADDIESWDSLSNVHMLIAVERKLNLRFSSFEISGSRNIGEFVALILQKLS